MFTGTAELATKSAFSTQHSARRGLTEMKNFRDFKFGVAIKDAAEC
jgi:hypothetical protein